MLSNVRHSQEKKDENKKMNIYGYLIDAEFVKFADLFNLVRISEQCVLKGYVLFGSFVHYLVWCNQKDLLPTAPDTIKMFLGTGRHIPADLDIYWYREKNNVDVPRFNKLFRDAKHIGKGGAYCQGPTDRYQINGTDLLTGPVNIDCLGSRANRYEIPLDFDVNMIVYNPSSGFVLDVSRQFTGFNHELCNGDNHTFACKKQKHDQFVLIKEKIMDLTCSFVFRPYNSESRKLAVLRIEKMLNHGFKIQGWDERFQTVEKAGSDCLLCREDIDRGIRTFCGGRFTDNLFCLDCFWTYYKEQANQEKMSCPLCRHEEDMFSFADLHLRS